MKKYVCIHGHFYQPPRENAWLDAIERQESAHPYHDWNARISAECYAPNGSARILMDDKRIISILNNYSNISFNFGPTLLSWLEKNDHRAYLKILEADIISQAKYNGHGNAIAQVYNHIIMPLANRRDKIIQIIWGIEDFKKRFNRQPEGMWLAETAVDTETLELLAENNIRFTILAPRQAKAVRPMRTEKWKELLQESELDTSRSYICELPSGNSITIFFYHGELAREVAFNGILNSGKNFAKKITSSFPERDAALINIATDGESYGHHHKHGDMALADCLDSLLKNDTIEIINYGAFAARFPAEYAVQIQENSSWSCVHGVERWRSDCGCSDGAHPGFHQKWRSGLRTALNRLRDELSIIYEKELDDHNVDVWEMRNAYIKIILDRQDDLITAFLKTFTGEKGLAERDKIIRLLEMQRFSLLMFTSCGWFFDEVSRIETKQILQYADKAIALAENFGYVHLRPEFLALLSEAPSNLAQYGNAAVLCEKEIMPQRFSYVKAGMSYAAAGIFEDQAVNTDIYNYTISSVFSEKFESGNYKLSLGRLDIRDKTTSEEYSLQYAVLYMGQHHFIGGYSTAMSTEDHEEMYMRMRQSFRSADIHKIIQQLHEFFGKHTFSFTDLLRDDQDKILSVILEKDLELAGESYKKIYDRTYSTLRLMRSEKLQAPALLEKNIGLVLQTEIRNFFISPAGNIQRFEKSADEAILWNAALNKQETGDTAAAWLLKKIIELQAHPDDLTLLDVISRVLIKMHALAVPLSLFSVQNIYFELGNTYIGNEEFTAHIGENYVKWLTKFKAVGEQMNIRF